VPLTPGAEITLEANPGTVEADRFTGFRDAGVNRLSIGVQSFDDRHLAALGRIHDAHEARRAIELAQRTFERVNIDLMYALPQQTMDEAMQDVGTALGTGVSHLSCYHLTLEPNTPFAAHPPQLPDDDASADMQDDDRGASCGSRLRALRNLGLRAARPAVPAQPELLAVR
jgi:coproporphyrinogen III oxidase-like Fe-S oxidoreductase